MVHVVVGDDEDDGGGAEGHPLLWSFPIPSVGHEDWADGPLDAPGQGAVLDAALNPRELGAQQLQQAAPELPEGQEEEKRERGTQSGSQFNVET